MTVATTTPTSAASTARVVVDKHLSVLLAAIGIVTAVVKLLSVSHGDPNTIGEILRSVPLADLALGTIISGAPNMVWLVLVWAMPQFGAAVRERDPLLIPTAMLLVTLLLVVVLVPMRLLVPVAIYLGFWTVSSIVWATAAKTKGKRKLAGGGGPPTPSKFLVATAFGAVIGWGVLAGSSAMWLPVETITTKSDAPTVGYVLNDDGAIIVMRSKDRGVARIESSDVASRFPCSDGSDPRTLLNRIVGHEKAKYERCGR